MASFESLPWQFYGKVRVTNRLRSYTRSFCLDLRRIHCHLHRCNSCIGILRSLGDLSFHVDQTSRKLFHRSNIHHRTEGQSDFGLTLLLSWRSDKQACDNIYCIINFISAKYLTEIFRTLRQKLVVQTIVQM